MLRPGNSIGSSGHKMNSIIECPIVFCDTAGVAGMTELKSKYTYSNYNPGEINIVKNYLDILCAYRNISIISPYAKHTELMKLALVEERYRHVEVSTIDGFQGRENDIILISLVRSNSKCNVGFLADPRRLNVAITRARMHVFVIGDSETLCTDPLLRSLYMYIQANGSSISAQLVMSAAVPIHVAKIQKPKGFAKSVYEYKNTGNVSIPERIESLPHNTWCVLVLKKKNQVDAARNYCIFKNFICIGMHKWACIYTGALPPPKPTKKLLGTIDSKEKMQILKTYVESIDGMVGLFELELSQLEFSIVHQICHDSGFVHKTIKHDGWLRIWIWK